MRPFNCVQANNTIRIVVSSESDAFASFIAVSYTPKIPEVTLRCINYNIYIMISKRK
jgi:hypothetical protein